MTTIHLPIYVVEAFSSSPFGGNPAAVVPLERWLSDTLMQSIAAQNNLSETAFFVATDAGFHIRWFTPTREVSLCGHATLASAYVLFEHLGFDGARISFGSLSGELSVSRIKGLSSDQAKGPLLLALNFPAQMPLACAFPVGLAQALGLISESSVLECFVGEDLVVVLKSAAELAALSPDFAQLKKLDVRAVIVTAAGSPETYDFVARVFAPSVGINEDPVTGSAYTKLAPIWSAKLGKRTLKARQLSPRGGDVFCELIGDRVQIAGSCLSYLKGEIEVSCEL